MSQVRALMSISEGEAEILVRYLLHEEAVSPEEHAALIEMVRRAELRLRDRGLAEQRKPEEWWRVKPNEEVRRTWIPAGT